MSFIKRSFFLVLLLSFISIGCCNENNGNNKNSLKITLYYESLCYDSIRFIRGHLHPYYPHFKDFINIHFVPYGKAIHNKINGTYIFECQHGKSECTGNKYQACALSQNRGQDKEVSLVYCIMDQQNPDKESTVKQCAEKLEYDWNNITECVKSEKGNELLATYGDKTFQLEPNLSFVPTIVYNDKYDQESQDLSLLDFAAVVCSKLTGVKPAVCGMKNKLPKKSSWSWFS